MDKLETNINVANVIGDVYGVEAEEGQKVFALVKKAFLEKRKVVLSFLNMEMQTTAFLNTAIGQLYKDFSEEEIKENLRVENISESDKVLLKRVVDTAKLFYHDKDTFRRLKQSIDEILGH
ncbi:MAG: STAS-like domain-containing protein [Tannerella sp.]|jgi:16S rRNA A1518/A1519 N6-dimethyltransferase RsmA/KsgA/DIM1 with predicted DNA glycosylase/AP lyase activity|nr:STAS-like domain-containing protein [Tannerella sp.]